LSHSLITGNALVHIFLNEASRTMVISSQVITPLKVSLCQGREPTVWVREIYSPSVEVPQVQKWIHSHYIWDTDDPKGERIANGLQIYLIHCKNLCKCHNILPTSTTIKETHKQKGL
jgi:hypothetical protein